MKITRVCLLALGLAGGVALSACGSNTAEKPPGAPQPAAVSPSAISAQEVKMPQVVGKPVDCGPLDGINGNKLAVIADTTSAGTVGCTEALNVLDAYTKRVPKEGEGTAHALTVQGWSCLADTGAGGTGNIACVKNGFLMHATQAGRASATTPAPASATQAPGSGGAATNVDCGPVDAPSGGKLDVVADATSAGTTGCTEAFNVLDEYLQRAAKESQGTSHELNVQGWSCLVDTGASASGTITCGKNGFAFHAKMQ